MALPKKSKNNRKKKITRKEKSNTALNKTASNDDLRKHGSTNDVTSDGNPALITVSDTNVFHEQLTAPARSSTPLKTPAAQSPTPTADRQIGEPVPVAPTPALSEAPVKWKAEDVAVAYIGKLDASQTRPEYIDVCVATKANIENCTVWKKNLAKNQTDVYPILDATLVKDPAKPDSYVNMSSVIVPHCSYPILMGQIPKRGLEEEFWRAAYNEQVVMMYVLVGSEDEKYDFFPKTTGSFLYYGEMFVNVRKVEKMDEERSRYTIEVLPNGFSNSVMMNVYVHTGWEPFGVPIRYANTTRSVVDVMNFVKSSNGSEKLLVVSKNGCGRAGFFITLGAAFCCLNDNSEPRIGEIVKAIRSQRPNAVESIKQYASLYLCLLYYIKKKITVPEGLQQKVEDLKRGLEGITREDLTIMF